jgi:hypothetical protein
MQRLLAAAALLVFIIGVPLYVATTATETFFAWTITTPLSAAFLGASYWAAGVLEWLASRQTRWCNSRIAVPAVLLFTVLTLAVTLIHLDRFHLNAGAPITLAMTWAWLIVYAVVPALMALILVRQSGRPGEDPPRTAPVSRGVRWMLLAQGTILGAIGLALLLAPSTIAPLWPWSLMPLCARAIGAWLVSLGVAAAHAAWENDYQRISPAAVSYLVLVALQLVALARFPEDFAWGSRAGMLYLAFLAWMLGLGVLLNLGRGAARHMKVSAARAAITSLLSGASRARSRRSPMSSPMSNASPSGGQPSTLRWRS